MPAKNSQRRQAQKPSHSTTPKPPRQAGLQTQACPTLMSQGDIKGDGSAKSKTKGSLVQIGVRELQKSQDTKEQLNERFGARAYGHQMTGKYALMVREKLIVNPQQRKQGEKDLLSTFVPHVGRQIGRKRGGAEKRDGEGGISIIHQRLFRINWGQEMIHSNGDQEKKKWAMKGSCGRCVSRTLEIGPRTGRHTGERRSPQDEEVTLLDVRQASYCELSACCHNEPGLVRERGGLVVRLQKNKE